jgi:hypothetical protein
MKPAPSAARDPRRTARQLFRLEQLTLAQFFLSALPHREIINVLPPRVSDVDCPYLSLAGHEPNSVGQAAIAIFPHPSQIIEKFVRAYEYSGVDGVVVREIFPNRDDATGIGLHFHCIIQVEDGFDFSIDSQIQLTSTCLPGDSLEHG